jgi:hypothetical protein
VTCFVLPISLGGDFWPWSSPQVIILFIVAFISLIAFVVAEKHLAKDQALIPVHMMRNQALLAAWANLFFYGVVFTSFLYYMYVVSVPSSPLLLPLLNSPFLFALDGARS